MYVACLVLAQSNIIIDGAGIYQLCIDLVAQKKIDLKPLVTHRFAFKDAVEAYKSMAAGKSCPSSVIWLILVTGKGPDGKPCIKVMISGPDIDNDLVKGVSMPKES
jgi:D-xylulose reductase